MDTSLFSTILLPTSDLPPIHIVHQSKKRQNWQITFTQQELTLRQTNRQAPANGPLQRRPPRLRSQLHPSADWLHFPSPRRYTPTRPPNLEQHATRVTVDPHLVHHSRHFYGDDYLVGSHVFEVGLQ